MAGRSIRRFSRADRSNALSRTCAAERNVDHPLTAREAPRLARCTVARIRGRNAPVDRTLPAKWSATRRASGSLVARTEVLAPASTRVRRHRCLPPELPRSAVSRPSCVRAHHDGTCDPEFRSSEHEVICARRCLALERPSGHHSLSMGGQGLIIRDALVDDANAMGHLHVRAWQAAAASGRCLGGRGRWVRGVGRRAAADVAVVVVR